MSDPQCQVCHKSSGVQFNIFNPAMPPFGTVCVKCEDEVQESLKFLGVDLNPAECDITQNGEVWAGLVQVIPGRVLTD
jgi:hypothetical protein